MSKYLNEKGIEPYITITGIVPSWMGEEDGKTLNETLGGWYDRHFELGRF